MQRRYFCLQKAAHHDPILRYGHHHAMMRHPARHNRSQCGIMDNSGFSLVEVLVGIALLAIFCIPLFQGFRYAAENNFRAHNSQSVTAYAQQVLETVEGMRVAADTPADVAAQLEDLLIDGSGAVTVTADRDNDALQAAFPGFTGNDFDRMFTPISYQQTDVTIGGKLYTLQVELSPLRYSEQNADGENTARDANIDAGALIREIDGLMFPVITDEVHRYEANQAILFNLQEAFAAEGVTVNRVDIYRNLVKEIHLDVNSLSANQGQYGLTGVPNEQIEVTCSVRYAVSLGGNAEELSYPVYRGTFALDCGTACEDAAHSLFTGWQSGGRIYLSARAYRETEVVDGDRRVAGEGISSNEIYVTCSDQIRHFAEGIDLFLIRGEYPNGISYHFDRVSLNRDGGGAWRNYYSGIPNTANLTGEDLTNYPGINFYTNIKGQLNTRALRAEDLAATIGALAPRLRSYDVTVTLIDQDTAGVVAQLATAKKVM